MVYLNPLKLKQIQEYGEDGIRYIEASQSLKKYITRKGKVYRISNSF